MNRLLLLLALLLFAPIVAEAQRGRGRRTPPPPPTNPPRATMPGSGSTTGTRLPDNPFEVGIDISRLIERDVNAKEVTFDLLQPEQSRYNLFFTYAESRAGISAYARVIRDGSDLLAITAVEVTNQTPLEVELFGMDEMMSLGIVRVADSTVATRIAMVRFPPVPGDQNFGIQIREEITRPGSYKVSGDELTFDCDLERARNRIVLPEGWYLTNSSLPATISTGNDGRVHIHIVNYRPDPLSLRISARRRSPG